MCDKIPVIGRRQDIQREYSVFLLYYCMWFSRSLFLKIRSKIVASLGSGLDDVPCARFFVSLLGKNAILGLGSREALLQCPKLCNPLCLCDLGSR